MRLSRGVFGVDVEMCTGAPWPCAARQQSGVDPGGTRSRANLSLIWKLPCALELRRAHVTLGVIGTRLTVARFVPNSAIQMLELLQRALDTTRAEAASAPLWLRDL